MTQHELTVYGPEGIIDNVDGKFRSYTWNLVEDYTFSVRVVELHRDGTYKAARFATVNRFIPESLEIDLIVDKLPPLFAPVNALPVLDLGEEFQLEYEFFDHRIPSVGYRITEPTRHAVNDETLADFGQKTGPWLGKLIKALKDEAFEMSIDVNGTEYTVAELNDRLIDIKMPQVVSYVTDCAPTEENIEKAVRFARNSTLLIIESPFLPEDKDHAEKKQHLTLDLSKKIFQDSGSEYVRFTHFAARYELEKQAFLSRLYEGMNNKVFTKNTL